MSEVFIEFLGNFFDVFEVTFGRFLGVLEHICDIFESFLFFVSFCDIFGALCSYVKWVHMWVEGEAA